MFSVEHKHCLTFLHNHTSNLATRVYTLPRNSTENPLTGLCSNLQIPPGLLKLQNMLILAKPSFSFICCTQLKLFVFLMNKTLWDCSKEIRLNILLLLVCSSEGKGKLQATANDDMLTSHGKRSISRSLIDIKSPINSAELQINSIISV